MNNKDLRSSFSFMEYEFPVNHLIILWIKSSGICLSFRGSFGVLLALGSPPLQIFATLSLSIRLTYLFNSFLLLLVNFITSFILYFLLISMLLCLSLNLTSYIVLVILLLYIFVFYFLWSCIYVTILLT